MEAVEHREHRERGKIVVSRLAQVVGAETIGDHRYVAHRTGPVAGLDPATRGYRSCRLALYRARVVDIELDDLARGGRRGHQRHALR